MPLVRRVPKRGFTNAGALKIAAINVGDLEASFAAGDAVTPAALMERGLIKVRHDLIKILGDGELTKKLSISAHRFSASAKEKIEQAGGEMVLLAERTPVEDKKREQRKAAAAADKAGYLRGKIIG